MATAPTGNALIGNAHPGDTLTGEVTDLLQQLIRNACVNDGTAASGHEDRSTDVLRTYLEGTGLDLQEYEPLPGRTSLLGRIEGSDPDAPSLMLMGHTDVVPVNPAGWSHDPHGGELEDGFVWGRGAVDMLNLTASMAVAFKHLATSNWKPKGTLLFLAVADEEAGGAHGAQWLCEHELDAMRCDYVITEAGGLPSHGPKGRTLNIMPAEKGPHWCRITVGGTPGHGSMPYRTDNAVVTAAEVVRRIASYLPRPVIDEIWRQTVDNMTIDAELRDALLDPARIDDALAGLPVGLARSAHACTHTTFSPNISQGGLKTNMIPDRAIVEVDIRALPGETIDTVRAMLADALGDLYDRVELEFIMVTPSTASPLDTPLWHTLERVSGMHYPGVKLVPSLMVATTDARFFRQIGATAYGYGLFSERINREDFMTMFHGHNERVDTESLRLSTELWDGVARDLLG